MAPPFVRSRPVAPLRFVTACYRFVIDRGAAVWYPLGRQMYTLSAGKEDAA